MKSRQIPSVSGLARSATRSVACNTPAGRILSRKTNSNRNYLRHVARGGLARGTVSVNADDIYIYISLARELLSRTRADAPAFGGVFANRYIFIWQLLARGSTLVCTYVGTSGAGRNSRLSGQTTTYSRAQHGSIFRLYCPLHLIWRPRSPLMGPRISRSSSGEGCADRSDLFRFFVKRRSQENSNSNQGIIPYFGFASRSPEAVWKNAENPRRARRDR